MDISQILTFGVPAIFIVIGLVEASKKLGASGNLCIILAIVYGVVLLLLQQAADTFPLLAPWVKTVVMGLIVGLSASGLFDVAKNLLTPKTPAA